MEALFSVLFYVIIVYFVVRSMRKKKGLKAPTISEIRDSKEFKELESVLPRKKESGSMPHTHRRPGKYDTFNKKTKFHSRESGSMPHEHKKEKYVSMADASNLPKGYILLNGEPVRVADLENK